MVTTTLQPKEHYSFNIAFIPTKVWQISYQLEFETLHNPFECHKVVIQDEGYQESVTFENLPEELEDELRFGDAIVNKSKGAEFSIMNTSVKTVQLEWSTAETGFSFLPSVGHLKLMSSNLIKAKLLSHKHLI